MFTFNRPPKNLTENKSENREGKTSRILEYYFRPRTSHDLSRNLKENSSLNIEDYRKVLQDHYWDIDYVENHDKNNLENKKHSFLESENLDLGIGWKFHLNCNPEDSPKIAEFLKENAYLYKYLRGGEPQDGKIFTIYVGSHELAKKLSNDISRALSGSLTKPIDHTEIEFAPGVIGRFDGGKKHYHQYGYCGFSFLKDDYRQTRYLDVDGFNEKIKPYEVRAFDSLNKDYGDYFYQE